MEFMCLVNKIDLELGDLIIILLSHNSHSFPLFCSIGATQTFINVT